MKFQTTTRTLRDLVQEFHAGAILLPQFQRDYVWKPAKIRNLLDSLLRGFPIGGFYLWRPISGVIDPKQKALGKHRIESEFVGYLIDGQQRLTSLEAAFGLYTGEDRGAELRCYLDLKAPEAERARDTRLFVSYAGNKSVARRVEAGDSTLIPVSQMFEGPDHELRKETEETLKLVPGWDAKRLSASLDRFDRASDMLDQQVPCTTISYVTDKEAVEVFSRLNKGGSALSQGDVRAAELARGHAVVVLKNMREFVTGERMQRLGFGFSFAFRALVLFHRESAQFSTLKSDWMDTPGPHGRSLSNSWRVTERAITEALAFVDQHMGWSRRALLPSANAVIVLAAALEKAEFKLGDDNEQMYRRWLCLTALRGVFQGSVETTINRFHRAIRESKKGVGKALVGALKRDEARRVRADEFNRFAQMWGPATQVMHAWLADQEAKDWLNGEPIDLLARSGSLSFPGGDLTVHHIFPREILASIDDNPNYANCPANYALLSRSTNSEFGSKSPDEVLASLTSEQRKFASVQFFGEAAGDRLKTGRYEEFCQWRADRLAESMNDWLGMD
jgi:hypothetical protein